MRLPLVIVVCLAGCSVVEHDYPHAWDPLQPSAEGCARFAGSYADRGETSEPREEPSLTYGLFGPHSPWKQAKRLEFMLPDEGVLEVTAWDEDKQLITRTFKAQTGEFACQDGRLVVHSKRWVAEDIVAGRQQVTLEFSRSEGKLVAHVKEKTYGTIFAVVPIAGTAAHWYRFARVNP